MENADLRTAGSKGDFFSNSVRPSASIPASLSRFTMSQTGFNKKGFSDKKLEFYAQKKKIVGARFSASSRVNQQEGNVFNKTMTSGMA